MEHTHRWLIDSPDKNPGPTSTGTCNCGAVREFQNYQDEVPGGFGKLAPAIRKARQQISLENHSDRHQFVEGFNGNK